MPDYAALGLKCGLELHQQLDTGKLFCRCPALLTELEPDITFHRTLRPVASELGTYDPAALEAYRKGISYTYQAYLDTNCLVEADEAPPESMDEDALQTVLEIALMCESRIQEEVFVMRKAVIDGSNTSAFQRTALIATQGKVPVGGKDIGVQAIVIEEDSARPMQRGEKEVVYRLDRLGIPLIELATEPELYTPQEVKAAARSIGTLFRRTGRVKRGLGTIRQDLNISIREGARVEIKGVQDLEGIDTYVEHEVQRQQELVHLRDALHEKGVREGDFTTPLKEVGTVFRKTDCAVIKNSGKGELVMACRIPHFQGLLGKELQPGRRLGTELAGYVKVRTGLKGIFHSDELPKYGISVEEVQQVAKEVQQEEGDAFVLVCATREKASAALKVVQERCAQLLKGVPEETRNALEGGNTE